MTAFGTSQKAAADGVWLFRLGQWRSVHALGLEARAAFRTWDTRWNTVLVTLISIVALFVTLVLDAVL